MLKLLLAALLLFSFLRADRDNDHVAIFSTITVSEDQAADDIVCAFCTVNIQGDVKGDVAVLFSTVSVGADRTISGDVATLFSTLRLGENSHVGGDLSTALSTADISSSATIGGSRSVAGNSLGLAMLAGPILILSGIIGLIIFFVRRNRYPYPI